VICDRKNGKALGKTSRIRYYYFAPSPFSPQSCPQLVSTYFNLVFTRGFWKCVNQTVAVTLPGGKRAMPYFISEDPGTHTNTSLSQ